MKSYELSSWLHRDIDGRLSDSTIEQLDGTPIRYPVNLVTLNLNECVSYQLFDWLEGRLTNER